MLKLLINFDKKKNLNQKFISKLIESNIKILLRIDVPKNNVCHENRFVFEYLYNLECIE